MHGYPVMQFVQYSVPPPCTWVPQSDPHRPPSAVPHSTGIKKYVVWCLICGGFSCLLGVLFLGVYFLLHSYTITVGNFETVPTFVPATLLILTGLCIMSLARRRNRYSYLIKLSGACGLVSALTCALVTVTTTVLHMSRLQALRECEYAQKTRTCTCYSDMIESQVERVDKEGVRLVFDSLSDCGVVHGSLYSCLRAIFGLSVAGVLVAVFSCMLVYQLLSHERKKMYWEQLELRCRSLYTTSQQGPPPNGPMPPNGPTGVISGPRTNMCRCCEQCHAHRQAALAPTGYPWDAGADGRFWTGQPPGNFYSPNPGGDDLNTGGAGTNRAGLNQNNQRARVAGWSWPRMPWQRSSPDPNSRYRQTPSSPDSQYGFSNSNQAVGDATGVMTDERVSCNMAHQNQQAAAAAAFNVMANGLPYGVWGPPPPYSDPNSPARGGRYQYMHSHSNQCQNMIMERQMQGAPQSSHSQIPNIECHQHSSSTDSHSMEPFCSQQASRSMIKRQSGNGGNGAFKTPKDIYENTPSDSDGPRDRFSNTLPVRKTKKRVVEVGAKSIGPNSHSTQRVNVQNVFMEHEYHEPNQVGGHHEAMNSTSSGQSSTCQQPKIKRLKTGGVENSGFQNNGENLPDSTEEGGNGSGVVRNGDPTESEVYFADVSSCCNVSVKNDNYYDDANQHHPSSTKDKAPNQPKDQSESNENEDYLAQRFGQRENSVRCRLPFPQQSRVEHDQLNLPVQSRQGLIPKDISRQSMCSVDSGEKTDFTDLSPATPCTNFAHPSSHFPNNTTSNIPNSYTNQTSELNESATRSNFVASFPFSSEQSQEAHRRSTKNIQDVVFLAPDAQYEVIKEPNQFENTPLTMATYDNEVNFKNSAPPSTQSHFQKSQHTPIKRPNISSIIQNLSNTDIGLLYPDSRRDTPSDGGHQILSKVERPGHLTASDNEWSDSSDRRL